MVCAFTPQVFPFKGLKAAIERGISEGFEGTDDASFVRRLGGEVAWVQGSRWNIKVTYPEDLALVEAILGGGGCA
jgi:2-C-methyl-D-erythritol 4-phosphate cytidylyltransferase